MSQPGRSKLPIRKRPFEGVANRMLGGSQPDWEELGHVEPPDGDAVTIGVYRGSADDLDRALADFAELYADQNELDYAALNAALKQGRVKAEAWL